VSLPRAHGAPLVEGWMRTEPEDFVVREQLSFVPGEGGEHLWLRIQKRLWNTMDVAQWLAKHAKLPLRAVGFSGLKDRRAVTEQWFSLHLPGKADPDFSQLPEGLVVLEQVRHGRKLNRGTHIANEFVLRLRQLTGELEAVPERLAAIASQGVPNYFGEQRFGRGGQNFPRAQAWLLGEGEAPRKVATRSLWLSAVRSELFNQVLAARVQDGSWNQLITGDVLQPEGSRGLFLSTDDERSAERLHNKEVNLTGPLVGTGGLEPVAASAEFEAQILAPHQPLIQALCELKMEAQRRSLRLLVSRLEWQLEDDLLTIVMQLPKGAFATTVLAELGNWQTAI